MTSFTLKTDYLNLDEEEFLLFCGQNSDYRIERKSNKDIIVMEPTGSYSGKYNYEISHSFYHWFNKYKYGYFFDNDTGFTLPNGAVRSPDLSWIEKVRWDNLDEKDKERYAHICPDFVIELLSPSDSLNVVQEKMQEYMDNGCRLGWLIDRFEKKVHIYTKGKKVKIVGFDKTLSGGKVLKGFELDMKTIEIKC